MFVINYCRLAWHACVTNPSPSSGTKLFRLYRSRHYLRCNNMPGHRGLPPPRAHQSFRRLPEFFHPKQWHLQLYRDPPSIRLSRLVLHYIYPLKKPSFSLFFVNEALVNYISYLHLSNLPHVTWKLNLFLICWS